MRDAARPARSGAALRASSPRAADHQVRRGLGSARHHAAEELLFCRGAAYSRYYVRPSCVTTYLGIDSVPVKRLFARLDRWSLETQARREAALTSRAVSC